MNATMANSIPASTSARLAPKLIRRETRADGICVLTFDRPDSAANIFDREALLQLDAHLAAIETDHSIRGVVLASAKESIFIAGADLKSLSKAKDDAELTELITTGQRVFNRLAHLHVPSAAAIHGACVGGGFEVCLACDLRIASSDAATVIGLPETLLGILPAWGGSTRLPRLIGLPAALDLILAGKTVPSQKAFKLGMVDGLAPREQLVETAAQWLLCEGHPLPKGNHRPSALKLFAMNSAPAAALIHRKVSGDLLKRTRGHYPAPQRALDVITDGLRVSIEESLNLETRAVVDLAGSEQARNLVNVFFLQERAKKFRVTETSQPAKLRKTAVIGAGVMGSGIAHWLASKGCEVVLRDINAEAVGRGMGNIERLFGEAVKRRKFTPVRARQAMDRIRPVTEPRPMRHAELVIEAAVERMDLKLNVFRQLEELTGPDTILATNTSALSISTLAKALNVPERVVGIHFFNPVHRMQLVEVIRGEKTDPEVLQRSLAFVQAIGKLPVVVKDSPGFVVNRILMPYLMEATRLFEQGAHIRDIDGAMLDFGMPMGPLRLVDEVGVDVAWHVCQTLAEPFAAYLKVPEVLKTLLDKKHLGKKSGRGFYEHRGNHAEPRQGEVRLMRDDRAANHDREQLRSRMVLLMINEAARCLEEGIVDAPDDIDFAMIMGTGFAPFRGGPLRHADTRGIRRVLDEMNSLAVESGHFHPCDLLRSLAASGGNFYTKHQTRRQP